MYKEEIIKEIIKKIENSKEFSNIEKKVIIYLIQKNLSKDIKIKENGLVKCVKVKEDVLILKASKEFILTQNNFIELEYFSERPFIVISHLYNEYYYREGGGKIKLYSLDYDIILNEGDTIAVILLI